MKKTLATILVAGLFALGIASAQGLPPEFGNPNQLLRVSYIDVGQGDAIFVRAPGGKTMLIDAGDDGDDAGEKIYQFLQENKITKIDVVVISHSHDDHFGGFFFLLDKVKFGKIYYGTRVNATRYMRLEGMIKAKKIAYEHIDAGSKINLSPDLTCDVLYAGPKETEDYYNNWTPWSPKKARKATDLGIDKQTPLVDLDDLVIDRLSPTFASNGVNAHVDLNATSVVLRLTHGQVTFLLAGDATEKTEDKMVDHGIDLSTKIYKASHHGSEYSNTNRILDELGSETTVISVGGDNSFGHPHKRAMDRFKAHNQRIFRTDETGTINVWSNGEAYVVRDDSAPNGFIAKPKFKRYHPRAVQVSFKAAKPSLATIEYGLDDVSENQKTMALATLDHEIHLTALEPSTTYKYRVIARSQADASDAAVDEGTFKTTAEGPDAGQLMIAPFETSPSPAFMKEEATLQARITNTGVEQIEDLTVEVFHTDTNLNNRIFRQANVALLADSHFDVSSPWVPYHKDANDLIVRVKLGQKILAIRTEQIVPRRRRIVLDANHDNNFVTKNRIADFLTNMRAEGYEVVVDDTGSIKASTLKKADVYVVTHTTAPFRPSEIKALKSYVVKGGSLLLTTIGDFVRDHGVESLNGVLAGLDVNIRFNDDQIRDDTNNYGSHPFRGWIPKYHIFPNDIINDPKCLGMITHGGTSLLSANLEPLTAEDGVYLLATGDDDTYNKNEDKSDDGLIIATGTIPIVPDAGQDIGKGKVVCFGGTHIERRDYLDDIEKSHQTPRYNRIIINWLSGRRATQGRKIAADVTGLGAGSARLSSTAFDTAMEQLDRQIRAERDQGNDATVRYLEGLKAGKNGEHIRRWLARRDHFRSFYE